MKRHSQLRQKNIYSYYFQTVTAGLLVRMAFMALRKAGEILALLSAASLPHPLLKRNHGLPDCKETRYPLRKRFATGNDHYISWKGKSGSFPFLATV
jgi:hypothetical protein